MRIALNSKIPSGLKTPCKKSVTQVYLVNATKVVHTRREAAKRRSGEYTSLLPFSRELDATPMFQFTLKKKNTCDIAPMETCAREVAKRRSGG